MSPGPTRIKSVRAALHGPGKYRVINTVEGLAEALLYHWPVEASDDPASAHFVARLACIAALEPGAPASVVAAARAAFIRACDEADIHVIR
jgi:hypothetical protein